METVHLLSSKANAERLNAQHNRILTEKRWS